MPDMKTHLVIFRAGERPDLMAEAAALRHEVFRNRLNWRVSSRRNTETDRHDPAALHAGILTADRMVGYCRALPTTLPYLISESFPDLLRPLPRSADLIELSRFAVAPELGLRRRHEVARETALAGIHLTHGYGAEDALALVEPWLERLLARLSFPIRRLVEPTVVGESADGPVTATVLRLSAPPGWTRTSPSRPLAQAEMPAAPGPAAMTNPAVERAA